MAENFGESGSKPGGGNGSGGAAQASTPVAARPSPWPDRDTQHAIRRRAIAEQAAVLFNEKGFHATSLNELADRLGVTKGALYHYVSGKDDIALEILRAVTEESQAVLAAASRDRSASGLERLRLFFVHYARMMATPIGACGVQIGSLPHSAEIRQRMSAFLKGLDQSLRAILQDGIRDGSIAPCDIRMTDFAVFGALNWVSRWYRADGASSPEELGEALFDVFAQGLRPRPQGTQG